MLIILWLLSLLSWPWPECPEQGPFVQSVATRQAEQEDVVPVRHRAPVYGTGKHGPDDETRREVQRHGRAGSANPLAA